MNSLLTKSDAPMAVKDSAKSGPSIYLNPEQTKAWFGSDVPKVGETYETEVKVKVASVSKDGDGTRATLELVGCECCEGAEEMSDAKESDKED